MTPDSCRTPDLAAARGHLFRRLGRRGRPPSAKCRSRQTRRACLAVFVRHAL